MNQHLIDHIDNKIHQACKFVTQYMPLDINTDNAYEAMLACSSNHTPEMIAAFQAAVKFLPPTANHKTFNVALADGRVCIHAGSVRADSQVARVPDPCEGLAINPESYFAAYA